MANPRIQEVANPAIASEAANLAIAPVAANPAIAPANSAVPPEEEEHQVDLPFLLSLLDVRSIVNPPTPRKLITLGAYGAIAGSVAAAAVETGFISYLILAARAEVLPLMIVLYSVEPVYFMLSMGFTSYPALPEKPEVNPAIDSIDLESQAPAEFEVPEENRDMALVIAAHNSAGFIDQTIKAALKILKPEQIFVIDNANSANPPDNTREIVQGINPKIRGHYHPRGNKTVAHFIGTLLAKNYSKILYTDDDVHAPAEFRMENDKFDDTYKMLTYRIRAIRKDGKFSYIIGWQDIEYCRAGVAKDFQDRFHGVLYHHGAVFAAEREFAIQMFYRHTTDFIAEDVRGGLIKEELGKKARMGTYYFATLAPTTYIGSPPNKLNQRLRSWNFGSQTLNIKMLYALLTQWPSSPTALAMVKYEQLYFLYDNLIDWVRPLMMAISATDPLYWARLVGILAVQELLLLYFYFVHLRHRPDLQQPFKVVATKFLDNIFEQAVTTWSLIRFLFIYLPNKKTLLTIPELDKLGEFEYIRELMGQTPGYKFLTHVEIPTRLYSGLDEVLGRWEIVVKAVTKNNLNEMESILDKAARDLSKQSEKSESTARYVALGWATLVLALAVAKVLLDVLGDPQNKAQEHAEAGVNYSLIIIGALGAVLTHYIVNSSMTANDLSRQAKISSSKLALFHQPVVSQNTQHPVLTHRTGRQHLS